MDSNEVENKTEVQTPEAEAQSAPVDSGRDVEELRAMIANMQTSIDALKAELQRKEPEKKKPADFKAYIAGCFGKKVTE